LLLRPPPRPTLFPYTTLFRSAALATIEVMVMSPLYALGRIRTSNGSIGSNAPCASMVMEREPRLTAVVAAAGWVAGAVAVGADRSEEHTSELQSRSDLVCRHL